MRKIERAADSGTLALLALGATGLSAVHPALSVAIAPAAAAAADRLPDVVERLGQRLRNRQERLLRLAAEVAAIDVEELVRRCENSPELEELLISTLKAASNTADPTKALAFAVSLAEGVDVGCSTQSDAQKLCRLIRILSEMDVVHVQVLDRFRSPSEALFDDENPDPVVHGSSVPDAFTRTQVEVALRDFPEFEWLVNELVRLGLIRVESRGGGVILDDGVGATPFWLMTAGGREMLAWLDRVGEVLRPR